MTDTEERLIHAGNVLARSLGHKMGCPKIAPSIPCSCGSSREQSQAINDWVHLIQQIKGS